MKHLGKPCAVGPNGRANSQARYALKNAMKRKMNQHLAKGGQKPAGSQAPIDDVMSANHDASSGPGLDLDEPSVTEFSGPSLENRIVL